MTAVQQRREHVRHTANGSFCGVVADDAASRLLSGHWLEDREAAREAVLKGRPVQPCMACWRMILFGRTEPGAFWVDSAWVRTGESDVCLVSTDGEVLWFSLEAECCSKSYFPPDSLKAFAGLVGERFRASEDVKIETEEDHPMTKYHAITIRTDRTSTTIDWRNESNGYYDGDCRVALLDSFPKIHVNSERNKWACLTP